MYKVLFYPRILRINRLQCRHQRRIVVKKSPPLIPIKLASPYFIPIRNLSKYFNSLIWRGEGREDANLLDAELFPDLFEIFSLIGDIGPIATMKMTRFGEPMHLPWILRVYRLQCFRQGPVVVPQSLAAFILLRHLLSTHFIPISELVEKKRSGESLL